MLIRALRYLIVFPVFFLVACSEKSGEDYFPFEVGLSKEYVVVFNIDNNTITGKRFDRIDSVEIIEGKEYLKYVTEYSGLPNFESSTTYYRMTSEGLYSYSKEYPDSPEILSYPMNLDVGTVWQIDSSTRKVQLEVKAIEDAVLFDRSYKDCLKIDSTGTGRGDKSFLTSIDGYEYICEREGEVKSVYTVNHSNGKVLTFSYSLVSDNSQSGPEKSESKTNNPQNLDIMGELTRPLAEKLLNEYLATPRKDTYSFTPGGLEQARQDGLVSQPQRNYLGAPIFYRFTPKGLEIVGDYIKANVIRIDGDKIGSSTYEFWLKKPVHQKVLEITGITAAPSLDSFGSADFKQVEYVAGIAIPKRMESMMSYLYGSVRGEIVFQKYDDGWRISK